MTGRQGDRETGRERERETDRQTDSEPYRHRETEPHVSTKHPLKHQPPRPQPRNQRFSSPPTLHFLPFDCTRHPPPPPPQHHHHEQHHPLSR
eukprot:3933015-Rhodomonas_salina.1